MIDFGTAKLLELGSFFLIGGGWLAWQLWETRPSPKRDASEPQVEQASPPTAS